MKAILFLAAGLTLSYSTAFASSNRPYCAETVSQIAIDEVTDMGFSGADLLNLASSDHQLDWGWDYKDGVSGLTIRSDSRSISANYIDSVAVYPDGSPEIAIICPNRVEVNTWITFTTDDGAFNERWYTKLYDTDGTDCMTETGSECLQPGLQANFDVGFTLDTLEGNFYSDVLVPEQLELHFFAQGSFTAQDTNASVAGQAYGCSEDTCYGIYLYGGQTY